MTRTDSGVGRLALAQPRASADSRREIDLPRAQRAAHDLLRALGGDAAADRRRGAPISLAVHAPPAPVSWGGAHRLPAWRADHRAEQTRSRRRALRPRPTDPGTHDDPDR